MITKYELLYCVEVSPSASRTRQRVKPIYVSPRFLDYPEEAAPHYAGIRAALKFSGQMIGANNLLIAAHARGLGLTLVTNNVREFGRVPGLELENWAEPEMVPALR